ncbi:MAG: phosphatidylglycerol---prolipoprotein diacylglyceryl transferase [Verrucomicrobiota bacterium]|jgi:phosphatidylglycerol:prolipoprotein diacylglycerol transferase
MLSYYLHNLDPFIFRLWGNVGPRWYGMAYVLAFVFAYLLLRVLSRRGYLDLSQAALGDFVTWVALFGVMIGGRIGYVLLYKPEMLRDPLSILRVWEGGMSSHGGILGVVVFTLIYSRRHKLPWTNPGDNLCVAAPIGLFLGRCANFINGELYGRITAVPWAVQFPKELLDPQNADEADRALAACQQIDPSLRSVESIVEAARTNPTIADILRGIITPRHPSQLYEALLEGVVLFGILWFVRTRFRTPNGFITGVFLVVYSILRIIVENFREPDASLVGPLTRGQFFSLFTIAIGAGFMIVAKKRPTYPRKLPAA